jgi:hypothetical protein
MLGAVPRTAYMTAEQFRLHRETGHSGSRMRLDFIVVAASALTTKTTSSNNAAPLV